MNYIQEIVLFNVWKEVNPLPASAIALWFELMAICNKTGWQKEFTVPNGVLQSKAGLSRKEFERARQILIQLEMINYKKSGRVNQAGKYELISFVQKVQQEGQQEEQQEGQRKEHRKDNARGTLFKLKQKDISSSGYARVYSFFQSEGFGTISSFIKDEIDSLVDDYSDTWVLEAMKEAVKQGKRSIKYVDGILKRWKADGIDSNKLRGEDNGGVKQSNRTDTNKEYDRLSL